MDFTIICYLPKTYFWLSPSQQGEDLGHLIWIPYFAPSLQKSSKLSFPFLLLF